MAFRNRSEREFAGYRDAIDDIVRRPSEPISVPLILHLHRQLLRHVDGRGGSFKSDQNLIVSYESGRREVVFTPPDEKQTPFLTKELVERYLEAHDREAAHPLVLLGAFVLDLLAIHPVADGNGRVARLATNSEMLRLGYGVPRYASVEQQIFETKSSYYASLAESQRGWHEGEHTIWPWVEYLAGAVGDAYRSFEQRAASARGAVGRTKQERVRTYVLEPAPPEFRLADVRRALPGISDETIRIVLNALKAQGKVRTEGRGPGARWLRT
jgi:Fic family protein